MGRLHRPMNILSVAHRAKVSAATVSRVVNASPKVKAATAFRVRQAIDELHYTPNSSARTLRSGHSNLLGVVVSDIRNPFFSDLIDHFETLALDSGIDIAIAVTGYCEDRLGSAVRRFLERRVDGIALFASEVSRATIHKLRAAPMPVVFLNQPKLAGQFRTVSVDLSIACHQAVEHLNALGHRRIGFVAGPRSLASAQRHIEAFEAALHEREIAFRKEWVLEGDNQLDGGAAAAERIFSLREPPTAMLCSNDLTAIGLMRRTAALGRSIPGDLSLVGLMDLLSATWSRRHSPHCICLAEKLLRRPSGCFTPGATALASGLLRSLRRAWCRRGPPGPSPGSDTPVRLPDMHQLARFVCSGAFNLAHPISGAIRVNRQAFDYLSKNGSFYSCTLS
jgi:LacI family transcriptional regulator